MREARAGKGEDRMVRSQPALEAERRRWFDFLAAECIRRDGLLCFYDREKSLGVVSSCQVLGRRLEARVAPPASSAPDPDREEAPCPFTLPVAPGGPG